MGLTAEQIAALLKPGDSRSYHDTGSSAEDLTTEYKKRTESYNRALGRLKEAWTGDSSDSAATSLSALQESGTVSAENLHNVSMQLNTQGESFSQVKNEVGDGPGPKPESTFASDHFPMFTDTDEKISQWNEKAQQVVDAYNTYSDGTTQNANVFPSTYGELTGDPRGLKFTVQKSGTGGTGNIDDPTFGGNSGSTSSSSSSSGGGGGSVPSFGGGGVGSGGAGSGAVGTVPSGGALTPGSSSGVGSGLPPGAIRLPDGSIQYPDGTIRTPDGRIIPPGGTRASSRGFGPGSSSGGSSGAGAAAAAGMMGGGMMGGVAAGGGDTAAPRSGFGPGGGSGSGAGPGSGMGGAKAVAGGMGGGMGRGGMGMGGMMGGGGGGRGGKGEDDAEHKDEYYIRQEMDPGLKTEIDEYGEKLVDESTGMTVVPPVIGE